MTRGGTRVGAGRKKKFTYKQLLALANEVALRTKTGVSISKALEDLAKDGYLRPETRNRYLTPKYFDAELLSVLKQIEAPRTGIAELLPRLSKEKPL